MERCNGRHGFALSVALGIALAVAVVLGGFALKAACRAVVGVVG